MRASRLVSALMLLQNRGRMTAQELADELEVSVRTVYRDMEALRAAGVPLYGEPGQDGGYQLIDGYRTRLTGLTSGEAETLFLTGLSGPAADLGLGALTTAAQLKLMAALPPDFRDRAARITARFHLDAPGWYRDADETPFLIEIADAVWTDHAVRIRYERWAEPREITRAVEPLGLVLKSGHWYLVARHEQKIRSYRVSRILGLDVLEEVFERPTGFVLAAHWQESLDDFDARRHTGEAVLRISPAALERLTDLWEPALAASAERTATAPDADGWVRAIVPTESFAHTIPQLLKLGTEAEVLAPPALREEVARILTTMADRYRTSGG
ncbi:helix-turn-helix transcriptional regulator [Streptomyces sp. NPDC050560]|uniref:helix-turn-helix transcriptional regulator n=1 Tax=Streptomyces sp. NPDC050560 TaxID=3365630 RepID=UPI00378C35F6